MNPTAMYWRPLANGQVACDLCPTGCRLRLGQRAPCASRRNRDGRMELVSYGRLVSAAADPIEKKPLYHFHPGRRIFSVAAAGCNLHCRFCQNWNISQQTDVPAVTAEPADLVAEATASGSVGIAYTYSEPLVWYEFVRDTASLAHEAGLKNVLVTNGYLNPDPLAALLPLIDAANIDVKSMDERFYRRVCKAQLAPVLSAVRMFHEARVHVELTNLLIPGHNDADEQILALVDWIAAMDPQIPVHFSAYHPAWRMTAPPTPSATLQKALELASTRLSWVYLGNTVLQAGRDTVCRRCGGILVARRGFRAEVRLTAAGACPGCGAASPLVTG